MKNDQAPENRYHLLIRFSDNVAPPEGTIEAHGNILAKHGYVWLGKFGKTIAAAKRNEILSQIDRKVKSYLLLAKSIRASSDIVVGELEDVRRTLPESELSKVPEYYRKNTTQVGAWFKIRKFWTVDKNVLRKFTIRSSGFPAFQSISEGMATFFFLIADADFELTKAGARKLPY